MKFIPSILLLAVLLFSCENSVKPADKNLLGEWRYVGNFSHSAVYSCYICPKFNYDDRIYRIFFDPNGQLSGRVNLLIVNGNYEISNVNTEKLSIHGNMAINKFQVLNKPPETMEDSEFQNTFKATTAFHISLNSSTVYDQLSLSNATDDYLLFARKK
jgi:hypothetical protein